MPTQGERQNFLWRPNDNSATTITRYGQEAEHWTRAFQSAQKKLQPTNYASDFAVIGLVISFFFNLVFILILLLTQFFQWILDLNNNKPHKSSVYANNPQTTHREKKVRQVLQNRPSVFQTSRHKLFKRAALTVIMKQKVSMPMLMYELKSDFETISQLLDQLYEAGIISGIKLGENRKVLIEDKVSLDLLLNLENKYSKI